MTNPTRTVCVVLSDRANYGRLKPVMEAIQKRDELFLQVVCGGSMVLERFSRPVELVKADGFHVDLEVYCDLEGSTPTSQARSVGIAVTEYAAAFNLLAPDFVLVIGDRFETLGAVIAACMSNRCVVHVQGGERSGTIDESTRHAITQFAHYHVPATALASNILTEGLGQRRNTILTVGCPSTDVAASLQKSTGIFALGSLGGDGIRISSELPYFLVAYHPNSYNPPNPRIIESMFGALDYFRCQTIWMWPNIDAGSGWVHKEIRRNRDRFEDSESWLRMVTNIPPRDYQAILGGARVAIGNSSSFVRDSAFHGTPVVLVGDRQEHREHGQNVKRVLDSATIRVVADAIALQNEHRYEPDHLYGDGRVSERIAEALTTIKPYCQKSLFLPLDAPEFLHDARAVAVPSSERVPSPTRR